MTLYISLGILVLLVSYMAYRVYQMRNMPLVADSEQILTLTSKNFTHQLKSGVILVDFWAVFNELSEIENSGFAVAKVNVEDFQDLAQQYKVRSIPTSIIFVDGKEVNRFTGLKSKSFLEKEIQNIMHKL